MAAKKRKITLKNVKAPKDLFTKIHKAIRDNPDRYQQRAWHCRLLGEAAQGQPRSFMLLEPEDTSLKELRSCTTAHCFAGWGSLFIKGGLQLELQVDGLDAEDVVQAALKNSRRDAVPHELVFGFADPVQVKRYIFARAMAEEGYKPTSEERREFLVRYTERYPRGFMRR